MDKELDNYVRTMISQQCDALKKSIEIGAETPVVVSIAKRLGIYVNDLETECGTKAKEEPTAAKKREKPHNGCGKYYIVAEEWNYPVESGHNILEEYDSREDAIECCKSYADREVVNFEENCKIDALEPALCDPCGNDHGGYLITPKNGLDPFYYYCRVIEVESL